MGIVASMLGRIIFISLFLICFTATTQIVFGRANKILYLLMGLCIAIVAFFAPSITKEEQGKEPLVLPAEEQEEDFHNDFTRVGSAEDYNDDKNLP